MNRLICILALLTTQCTTPSSIRNPISRMPPYLRNHYDGVAYFLYQDCKGTPGCDSIVNAKMGKMMLSMSPEDYEKLKEAYRERLSRINGN